MPSVVVTVALHDALTVNEKARHTLAPAPIVP